MATDSFPAAPRGSFPHRPPPLWGFTVLAAVCLGASATAQGSPRLHLEAEAHDAQARSFVVELDHAQPMRLTCEELGGTYERHLRELAEASTHRVTLRGFKAETNYRCWAEATGGPNLRTPSVTFITAPLPIDLKAPQITVPSTDVSETGYTMYGYGVYRGGFKSNYLVILDAEGNIRWYLPGPGAGDVDATYLGNDQILYGGMSATYYRPTIVGLDKVTDWQGTSTAVASYERVGQTNHDAGISEDGKSVFHLNYATLDGYYLVFIVKQIDIASNQVVWSWDSIVDGLDVGELPGGGSSSDLYHANSIDEQWENGRRYVYVGLRNFHRVIKIDYETKEVVWKLGVNGDFQLLEANGSPAANSRWFFHQHDIKLDGPNRFSVYDNGSARSYYGGTNYSRALQLELDQVNMTARIVFEYQEPGWLEAYWGGYDVLSSGNSVIAMGHFSSGSSSRTSGIVELDSSGTVVWRADFRSDKDAIYRTDRIDGCAIFDNTRYCPRGPGSMSRP